MKNEEKKEFCERLRKLRRVIPTGNDAFRDAFDTLLSAVGRCQCPLMPILTDDLINLVNRWNKLAGYPYENVLPRGYLWIWLALCLIAESLILEATSPRKEKALDFIYAYLQRAEHEHREPSNHTPG